MRCKSVLSIFRKHKNKKLTSLSGDDLYICTKDSKHVRFSTSKDEKGLFLVKLAKWGHFCGSSWIFGFELLTKWKKMHLWKTEKCFSVKNNRAFCVLLCVSDWIILSLTDVYTRKWFCCYFVCVNDKNSNRTSSSEQSIIFPAKAKNHVKHQTHFFQNFYKYSLLKQEAETRVHRSQHIYLSPVNFDKHLSTVSLTFKKK